MNQLLYGTQTSHRSSEISFVVTNEFVATTGLVFAYLTCVDSTREGFDQFISVKKMQDKGVNISVLTSTQIAMSMSDFLKATQDFNFLNGFDEVWFSCGRLSHNGSLTLPNFTVSDCVNSNDSLFREQVGNWMQSHAICLGLSDGLDLEYVTTRQDIVEAIKHKI